MKKSSDLPRSEGTLNLYESSYKYIEREVLHFCV